MLPNMIPEKELEKIVFAMSEDNRREIDISSIPYLRDRAEKFDKFGEFEFAKELRHLADCFEKGIAVVDPETNTPIHMNIGNMLSIDNILMDISDGKFTGEPDSLGQAIWNTETKFMKPENIKPAGIKLN